MRCPTCGVNNPNTARYCIRCGGTLPPAAAARQRRSKKPVPSLPLVLGGAIAAVLLLLCIAVAVLLKSPEEPTVAWTLTAPSPGDSPTVEVEVLEPEAPPAASTPAPTPGTEPEVPATAAIPPTPSPVPSVTPTASAIPSATPAPTRTRIPTATATRQPASPACRKARKGLIGFKRQKRCDSRTGNACGPVEIWVMNADGSNQAKMCNSQAYTWGLTRDRTSPDGAWRVEVTSARRGTDIMRLYLDSGRQEMIIVNNGMDWDPVLSADGWWLAWVTNRNANDEIYSKTMDPFDQNQRRLTVNDWEWDKHPTWSPDGRRIAFYSNRADKLNEATRQIWVMEVVNDQGVNLHNLSNRPDKVDTDPVWFKWDDMPY